MKNILLFICSFIVVLFVYIHIQHHYYVSNDLEISVVMSNLSKVELNELFSIRQPLLFNHQNITKIVQQYCNLNYLINTYPQFDININDTPVQLNTSIEYFKTTPSISIDNTEFLSETGISSKISMYDLILRPDSLFSTNYDLIISAPKTSTTLQYKVCYRTFIIPASGNIRIKCCPPKNTKYLMPIENIEKFSFESEINCWNDNDLNHFAPKVKFLEFNIEIGQIFYIPPYWWYSLYNDDNVPSSTFVCCYSTYMNNIANINLIIHQALQQQNIKKTSIYCKTKIVSNDELIQEEKIIKKDDKKKKKKMRLS